MNSAGKPNRLCWLLGESNSSGGFDLRCNAWNAREREKKRELGKHLKALCDSSPQQALQAGPLWRAFSCFVPAVTLQWAGEDESEEPRQH